jgi:hypothetical protein
MTGLESIIEEIEAEAKKIASKKDDETEKRIAILINEANKNSTKHTFSLLRRAFL